MPEARHIYSVTEITKDIKLILENTFSQVWVEGEISNFRFSSSGHYYPSLKDQNSILQLVIFNRVFKDIKFRLEDGLKVICYGQIEVYPPRGTYQLIVEKIEPKGIGSLQLALEQLKEKLEKEGLFSEERKRPIPYLPAKVGVVTSLQGAAIKDILKVLERRFKDTHVIIYPVRVQGEGAKEEISGAIKDLNLYNEGALPGEKVEVMIVGRGGGSIEDLWAFNEEIVARAIYNSRIPVISAVGHERDVTVADLVADRRASTPSVAAELVMPRKEDLRGELIDLLQRLIPNMEHLLELNAVKLSTACKKLSLLNPAVLIQQYKTKTLDLARQIYVRAGHLLKLKESVFTKAVEKLASLSPLNILSRGYSITFKLPEGTAIKDASVIKVGDTIETNLHKGRFLSKVTEV